ncbi:uncharacterized protein LOC134601515 [Pelobates fuscus]|uniref:uncharacterized protein LOC134601515 n=1 Tax=Pelobates fuscus TaxID=191477 RepID=UPI002FE4E346
MNGHFSMVDYPKDFSLRIHNVEKNDLDTYCCSVRTSEGEFKVKHGTELVIEGSRDNLGSSVHQPQASSAHLGGSATIKCSYSTFNEREPMETTIYWTAGSPQGLFAFHPAQDMIDSTYRGRTKLTNNTDLQITGVQVNDDTVYYCLVMLKFCVVNPILRTNINYGIGTRLRIREFISSQWPFYVILAVRFTVFCIVIICGILGYRGIKRITAVSKSG